MILAIAYLLLVIRQNIWCWICAGLSSAIYVWLFIVARLYMESLLYGFYVAMAVYGWISWQQKGQESADLPIKTWAMRVHALAVAVILMLSLLSGRLLLEFTDAAYPYIDSLTTFAAVWATFLVARKILENWWYWLLIDAVSIVIYWSRGLELTSLLFVVYVILIPIGMIQWHRSYNAQTVTIR